MEATDSERGLCGAAILWPERMADIRAVAQPEDFAGTVTRAVFTVLCEEDAARRTWDAATLIGILAERDPPGDGRTWGQEVEDLGFVACNPALVMHHARLVRSRGTLARTRHLLASLSAEVQDVRVDPEEIADFLADATGRLAKLSGDGQGAKDDVDAVEAMRRVVVQHRAGQTVHGLATGIGDLDDILLGLRAGELLLLGARPGAGKTAMALQVAINIAEAGAPGLFLSLEMPTDSLGQRLVSNLASIDSSAMRRGNTGAEHWRLMDEAVADMAKRQSVRLISDAGTPLSKLRGFLRKRRQEGLLGFAVIDYLQLMRHPGAKDKLAEVGEISRGLKEMSIEFAIPILALSQLNRAADGVEPTMANLRESGSLEQDADVVILLNQGKDGECLSGQVVKNRHGRTGKFELAFLRHYFRVTLLARSTSSEIYK
jgi:Replicative DNA helicase